MLRILESDLKDLMRAAGVTVPEFATAHSATEAAESARKLGYPVVVKALIPTWRKAKQGGVLFANDEAELVRVVDMILHRRVAGFDVEAVLVERRVAVAKEYYACVTIDHVRQVPLILISHHGGVDIEEAAAVDQGVVHKIMVDPLWPVPAHRVRQAWLSQGVRGPTLVKLTDLVVKLYRFFLNTDAQFLEVNPVAETPEHDLVVLGALCGFDEAAQYRQPHVRERVIETGRAGGRRPTEEEAHIAKVNQADPNRGTIRFTKMERGDIGFLCGAGGGSLLLFDTMKAVGLAPANYTEFGGNPSEDKMYELTRTVLSRPGLKGLLVCMNITNNTQVDVVARGVLRGIQDSGVDLSRFPIVIRLPGVNEAEARRLFESTPIEYHGDDITMIESARLLAKRLRTQEERGNEIVLKPVLSK